MKWRSLFILAILAGWGLPAKGLEVTDGPDVPELAMFDDAMLQFMAQHDIPDGQLAMTWQGRLVLARAYSNGSDQPVDLRSRFRVASVSKPITSTLIHHLQQHTDFSVEDPVVDYLDFTPPQNQLADARLGQIKVRHLLEHLGGFGEPGQLGFDPMFWDGVISNALQLPLPLRKPDIQRYMSGRQLLFDPGSNYAYSNYGYMLAGRVLEAASGLPYGAYADMVLNPLGIYEARLARTQQHRAFQAEAAYQSGRMGTTVMDGSGVPAPLEYGALNYENLAAAGGWTISMVEAARWLASLDDPDADDAPLDSASLALMFGLPDNWSGPYTPGSPYYGSGWSVRDYGATGFNTWHAGSLPSTTSYVVRIRTGWNYAVVFNRRDENGGDWHSQIDQFMTTARGMVQSWPAHDLFPQLLQPAPDPMGPRHSGSWYDPTHSGEGFVIQAVDADSAVVYWFTYDEEGRQRWYFGVGDMVGHRLVIEVLYATSGGRFGPDFDPDEVTIRPAGALVLNFLGESSGKADYLLDGLSGSMEIKRITQPFVTDDPATAGNWRNGLWYDRSHSGEGFVVEVLPSGTVVIYWFTYDANGGPAWMVGQLASAALAGPVDLTMLRPLGGNFGVAFDPSRVQRLGNGAATFVLGCGDDNAVDYADGDDDFPDVGQALVRLTTFVAADCE